MPRKKTITIVESSSDESARGNHKRSARIATPNTSRTTRHSTRNAPTAEKPVAPKVAEVSVPSPLRTSKRKAAEEHKPTSAPVKTPAAEQKDTAKRANKAEASSTTVKKVVVNKPKNDLKIQDNKGSGVKSTGNKDRKQNNVKSKGIANVKENPWLYPNMLDAKSSVANNSAEMDIDQPHGYVLQYILRAHSRSTHEGHSEDIDDTWALAFQPTLPVLRSYSQPHVFDDSHNEDGLAEDASESEHESDEDSEDGRVRKRNRRIAREKSRRGNRSSGIVATCGGNTVCLVDCSLGRVMAKYSHVEEEEFMCLAWTTLDHYNEDNEEAESKKEAVAEERHDQSNILAAAGRMGSIKLINPLQNTCYKYLHGHTDSILRLKFSLTNPRWLFSASTDGTARLWDIGSLANFQTEACCLARFVGLDDTSVTAIGVSEKYLIVGTEKGLMAQYDLIKLAEEIRTSKKSIHLVKPEKIYPPSQEWHESTVDEIIYIPYFSKESYATKKSIDESKKKSIAKNVKGSATGATRGKFHGSGGHGRGRGGGRGRGRGRGGSSASGKNQNAKSDDEDEDEDEDEDDDIVDNYEGEFVFASRESCQGEIIVWEASKSTESDAKIETILEWPIAESWAKFTLGENITTPQKNITSQGKPKLKGKGLEQRRQNVLVAGTTDGKVIMFDLNQKPKRGRDGNIIAEKPSNILSHSASEELFRDVAVSQDLSTIVAGDWSNRVFIWNYHAVP
ncbi:hypothetical protein BGX27_001637 [Mortierella sp. AM989]|nr:hypothetical protein BGX27_001637 [Mortierella sp. AM989]